MERLHWTDARSIETKRGNPWIVTPTRAMVLGLDVKRISRWKIEGVETTVEVTYDYDYAVAWGKHKLMFLSQLPGNDRDIYLSRVFPSASQNNNSVSTKTKSRKNQIRTRKLNQGSNEFAIDLSNEAVVSDDVIDGELIED